LVGVGLALSLPAAIAIAALIEGQQDVSAAKFLRVLCVIGPLFVAFAFWIYRGHFIVVSNENAAFAFTRYGFRRSVALSKESLRSVSYLHGTLAIDGRPRPLIEYELVSGERGWIPLALYSRRLIDALRSDLRSNGIEVIERDASHARRR
jgi:hypothetical protein